MNSSLRSLITNNLFKSKPRPPVTAVYWSLKLALLFLEEYCCNFSRSLKPHDTPGSISMKGKSFLHQS